MFVFIVIVILVLGASIFLGRKLRTKDEKEGSDSPFQVNIISQSEDGDDPNWEIVYKNSERWRELGYYNRNNFPGYGRLYQRKFRIWYCQVGTKEEKNVQYLEDTSPINYQPKNCETITGVNIDWETLTKAKGYLNLMSGLDSKNRKRWYAGLEKADPTGIQVKKKEL